MIIKSIKFLTKYWLIIFLVFSAIGWMVLSAPLVETLNFNKKNEHFYYEANITGVWKVEVYIEYQNTFAVMDITEIDLANQTAPLLTDYLINDFQQGSDWIYLDIEFWVDKAIQREIDRVALCLYSVHGGVFVYEMF